MIEVGVYVLRFVDAASSDSQITTATSNLDRMQLLLDVTRSINSSLALREVLERVIDAVTQLTQAERGFLMTLSPTGDLGSRLAATAITALESIGCPSVSALSIAFAKAVCRCVIRHSGRVRIDVFAQRHRVGPSQCHVCAAEDERSAYRVDLCR